MERRATGVPRRVPTGIRALRPHPDRATRPSLTERHSRTSPSATRRRVGRGRVVRTDWHCWTFGHRQLANRGARMSRQSCSGAR